MIRQVHYFDKPGKENTEKCVEIAASLLDEGYKHIVVATTTGDTGAAIAKKLQGKTVNLVVVTHPFGFKEPNHFELLPENRDAIQKHGGKIYTTTILTHSIETAFAQKFEGLYPTMIVSQSLRRLGEGIKVCCEIVLEACDGGLIPEFEEVIAVAGTARGADTVCIIKSAASKRFLDLRVLEIAAKPRQ
ncbi:MAG: hypothetical protein E3K32_11250 [wastewater metagenome]|nr:hypothetical protein [Candidatus Loosdrechtia aerotolerans]